MSYLKEFEKRIYDNNYPSFLKLWEEYCYCDEIDPVELISILKKIKDSDLNKNFGSHVYKAISLLNKIDDDTKKDEILKLIFDIQNINTRELAEFAFNYLRQKHQDDENFDKKIRLIGLTSRSSFQGAIRGFELLSHLKKGKFVYHTAGWGTGEVLDYSLIREEVTLEFDLVLGAKTMSFKNALKTLIALEDDHFLAQRFGTPDELEKKGREDPLFLAKLLLKDLGPKNAQEIKEEICDLVIPESEWAKWWQLARQKLKKDTKIHSPKNIKEPFYLLEKEISHEDNFYKKLEEKPSVNDTIQLVYTFLKNFPETYKNQEFISALTAKLKEALLEEELTLAQKLQLSFLIEDISDEKFTEKLLENEQNALKALKDINIALLKKKLLISLKKYAENWKKYFCQIFTSNEPNILKDYIFQEFLKKDKKLLEEKIKEVMDRPVIYPETFIWYFQKVIKENKKIFFSDDRGKCKLLEGYFILIDHLSNKKQTLAVSKKMLATILANRFKIIRDIFKISTIEEIKEFMLLTTKCSLLESHDLKIIQSLAEVAYPQLREKKEIIIEDILWTTPEAYQKVQQKIKTLATTETIKNAKEIAEARALGDLRENAEYKAALEKRSHLQGEIKRLTEQFNKARILSKEDINEKLVGVGAVIECVNEKGEKQNFTILGPWDAYPEKNILSFKSKFAQNIEGLKEKDTFEFQKEKFTIEKISNYFDKN